MRLLFAALIALALSGCASKSVLDAGNLFAETPDIELPVGEITERDLAYLTHALENAEDNKSVIWFVDPPMGVELPDGLTQIPVEAMPLETVDVGDANWQCRRMVVHTPLVPEFVINRVYCKGVDGKWRIVPQEK